MQWQVKGADRQTGADRVVIVEAENENEAVKNAVRAGIFVESAILLREKPSARKLVKPIWIMATIVVLAVAFGVGVWACKKNQRSSPSPTAVVPSNLTKSLPNPTTQPQSPTDAERLAQVERELAQANDLIRRQQEQINTPQRAPANDAQSPEALSRSFSSFADHFVKQAMIYQNGNGPSGRGLKYKLISAEVIKTDSLSHPIEGVLIMEQILSDGTLLYEDKDTAKFAPEGQGWKFVSGETLVEDAPSESEFSKPGQTKTLPDYWVAAVLAAK
jgi:hypothetical protein